MAVPTKWADYVWPEWIPQKVRKEIMDFWCESWGRGPHEWLKRTAEDKYNQHDPPVPMGTTITVLRQGVLVTGRWVPCWNNMGRLIDKDGSDSVTSTGDVVMSEEDIKKLKADRLAKARKKLQEAENEVRNLEQTAKEEGDPC